MQAFRKRASLECLEQRTLFNAGDLDLSFSGDGANTIQLGGGSTLDAKDVAVQSDGKTIVVGGCSGGALAGKIIVARFDSAGALDLTFGGAGTGIASTDYLEFNSNFTFNNVASVAVQSTDNKIVVLGHVTQGNFHAITLTRFAADGQLDSTFSGDGKVLIAGEFDDDFGALASDVIIQHDGKIVFACTITSYPDLDQDFGIARFNTNGTYDSNFSGDGRVVVGFGNNEFASSLAIDSFGRIVVVGYSGQSSNATDRQFAIARLTAGGSLDGSFSGDGKVLSRFTGGTLYSDARAVVVQPSGKIVILGRVGSADFTDHDFGLFRLNDNGTGDAAFGVGNGQISIDFGGGDAPNSMVIGQTGRLIVGGTNGSKMTFACLTAEGQLDGVFGGGDAKQVISFGYYSPASASVRGMVLGPNGTIVAAGGTNFATARLFDRKFATISIGNFQPQMFEQGTMGTSFIVGRLEALPTETQVFIGAGGQATPPNTFPIRPRDYNGTNISFGNGQTSSTFVTIPAGATFVNVVITPVDDASVEGDEVASFGIAGTANYDVANPTITTLVIRDNDTAVPAVNATAFLFETAPQRLTFRFTQDVGASLSAADFQITGATGIPSLAMAYDNITNTATLSFAGILPDGNFNARAIAAAITNALGTTMPADANFPFFFLAGDANRDRAVDISDFAILAGRFNLPGTFSQGDFNYDGVTNIGDFSILASKFNTTLPIPLDLPLNQPNSQPRSAPWFSGGSTSVGAQPLAHQAASRTAPIWNDDRAIELIDEPVGV